MPRTNDWIASTAAPLAHSALSPEARVSGGVLARGSRNSRVAATRVSCATAARRTPSWDDWNATSDTAPTGDAPALTVDGLADGSTAASREITVSGTTDAPQVSVAVDGVETAATVTGGSYSAAVTLPDVTNRIVVVATGENGVVTVVRRTVTALGALVGALSDPVGDDHGPGTYTYPTDSAFTPGSFDLTGLRVYRDGDLVRFVTSTAGGIANPWGGDGMSTQRVSIALRDGVSTVPTPLLPGTNTYGDGAWTRTVVAAGRFADTPYGGGVFGADGKRIAPAQLDVDPAGVIIASVPASTLEGIDLAAAGYQVSMFADAEEGEGLGNVRPIYSTACAEGDGCPDFVRPYRGAGGAGEFTSDLPSRDTDTRDSNAFDMITGDADQSVVMDWTRGDVVAPYLTLDLPGTGAPEEPGGEPGGEAGGETAGGGGQDAAGPGTAAAIDRLEASGGVLSDLPLWAAGILMLGGLVVTLLARRRSGRAN